MKQWMLKNACGYLNKVMLILTILMVVIFLPLMLIGMDEIAEALAVTGMIILVFGICWGIGALAAKASTKRLIKSLEEAGIDVDTNLEESEIEWIDSFGFYKDWVLNKKRGFAFHKDFITDCYKGWVGYYRNRHYGVQIVCKNGKSYDCIGKIKYYDEVVTRIKKLYLAENYETVMAQEAENKAATGGKNDPKMIGIIVGVAVLVIGLICVSAALRDDTSDNTNTVSNTQAQQEENPIDYINYYNDYDKVADYSKYLDEVSTSRSPDKYINVYYDVLDEGGYLAIMNDSDYYMFATIDFYAKDASKSDEPIDSVKLWMLRPHGIVAGFKTIGDTENFQYVLKDARCYEYTKDYPSAKFITQDDYDKDGVWTNIVIDSEDFSEDAVKDIMKHMYGSQVVEDITGNFYYIYNEKDATKYDEKFYDPSSALYYGVINLKDKTISVHKRDDSSEDGYTTLYEETISD